jgi:hypothetical protein
MSPAASSRGHQGMQSNFVDSIAEGSSPADRCTATKIASSALGLCCGVVFEQSDYAAHHGLPTQSAESHVLADYIAGLSEIAGRDNIVTDDQPALHPVPLVSWFMRQPMQALLGNGRPELVGMWRRRTAAVARPRGSCPDPAPH